MREGARGVRRGATGQGLAYSGFRSARRTPACRAVYCGNTNYGYAHHGYTYYGALAQRVEQLRVERKGVVVGHIGPTRRRLAARDEARLRLVGKEHVRHFAQDRQRAPVAAREDALEWRRVEGVREHRGLKLLGRLGRAVREEDDAPHALQPGRALHAAARPVEALRRHQPDHYLGQLELAARSFHLRLCRHPLRLGLARR